MGPDDIGLRDFLTAKFDGITEQHQVISTTLGEIRARLEGVEGRVATTNGQLISHRFRLESLEQAAVDPSKQPAMTVSESKIVARAAGAAATLIGLAWAAVEAFLRLFPAAIPAVIALLRGR